MKSKSLAAVPRLPRRDLTSRSPYNTCMGLQMTSLLPTSSIRPFSRPCVTPLPADYVILPTNSATQQPALVVSNESVYKKLMKLNRSKAHGPDGIPGWVLKENADLLAAPIADILNSSYREGRLPPSWKEADVVLVPKQRPVQDINKHLRPISLTPNLSKKRKTTLSTLMSSPLSSQRSTHSNLERCPNPALRMH